MAKPVMAANHIQDTRQLCPCIKPLTLSTAA